jgi:quinol monooxygenase YgiN
MKQSVSSSVLTRIVKMTFQEGTENAFLFLFEESAPEIRKFPGCLFLALYRDAEHPNIYFTYSRWKQPEDLRSYRNSELFQKTWALTRVHFASKAEAWSLESVAQYP